MKEDLVSVIMPTFNESRFLAQSIESVLNQTYTNLELLITDDCSTDEKTLEILDFYSQNDHRVQVFRLTQNMGAGAARNNSISRAKGRYFAFCDSDDRWLPTKLERQIEYMQKKNCCMSFSSYILCDQEGVEKGIVIAPVRLTLRMLMHDNKVGCLTAVYDTQRFGKFYMPTLRKRQDWGLFLMILQKCKVAYGIQKPLAFYRLRPHSISKNKLSLVQYNVKVYQKILGFSVVKSYCYFTFLFMPNYAMKLLRNKINSKRYINRRYRS